MLDPNPPESTLPSDGIASMLSPMPVRVLKVETTPNPNARKFVLSGRLSERPESFFSAEKAAGHPLACRLFSIPGVTSVLVLGDFVTVNKSPETPWPGLVAEVRKVLSA
jgi:hypothetical protein